jgi:hypothetical protein
MAQGDVQKADYLLNCSWYEYCYRKDNYRKYVDWYNKEVKEVMTRK